MSHSENSGGSFIPKMFWNTLPSSPFSGTFSKLPVSFQSRLVGVGHEPKSVPSVGATSVGTSWKYNRPRGVPCGLQRIEKIVEVKLRELTNLLTNEPTGPDVLYNCRQLSPEDTVI